MRELIELLVRATAAAGRTAAGAVGPHGAGGAAAEGRGGMQAETELELGSAQHQPRPSATGSSGAMSASEIASLTQLSVAEVNALLGPMGGSGGSPTSASDDAQQQEDGEDADRAALLGLGGDAADVAAALGLFGGGGTGGEGTEPGREGGDRVMGSRGGSGCSRQGAAGGRFEELLARLDAALLPAGELRADGAASYEQGRGSKVSVAAVQGGKHTSAHQGVSGRVVGNMGGRLTPGGQARLGVTPGAAAARIQEQLQQQAAEEGVLIWDPANLQLLLQHAEQEVAAAEARARDAM